MVEIVLVYVDLYWFVVFCCGFDYLCELCVVFCVLIDVVGVDLVF